MLGSKRIEEAEENVRRFLAEGLLQKREPDSRIAGLFIKNSNESLEVAGLLKDASDFWVIVSAYYSMYYLARAVLLKLGYKLGDRITHRVTADALIVYARGKLRDSLLEQYEEMMDEALNIAGTRADEIIESFDLERRKRGFIQYKTEDAVKHAKALTSFRRAKEFSLEMGRLLSDIEQGKRGKKPNAKIPYKSQQR